MKNTIIIVVFLLIAIGFYLMFKPSNDTKVVNNSKEIPTMDNGDINGSYEVLPQESIVQWTAEKAQIIGYTHNGTMPINNGSLSVNGPLVTGLIEIDMTGVKLTSMGGGKEGNESKLEAHLKTGDFFDVETYPTSVFTITSSEQVESGGEYNISGNLTMKNITNEITFPATLYIDEGKLHFDAELVVDRTAWGINFGSSNFFDNLAENAISNEVLLLLNIVAEEK